MPITIYHNPRCSKSRKTLGIIQSAGVHPEIVNYLNEPPSADRILRLAELLGLEVRDLLRQNEAEFRESNDLPDLTDNAALAEWMSRNPKTMQRPIVVDDEREIAIVGRPPENVAAVLP